MTASAPREYARSIIQSMQKAWGFFSGATLRHVSERDVNFGLRQKGVDMRIGLDIASMTLKRQVDTLILVTGDSDFVPAAKLARREGVEFLLDPISVGL